MNAGDGPVERDRDVVRGRLTDRDPVAREGDALPGALDPHLEVVAAVTHGDGNLSRGDGSVARGAWSGGWASRTIAPTEREEAQDEDHEGAPPGDPDHRRGARARARC